MAIREGIGEGFERWSRLLVRRRWLAIASMLALAAGLGAQLPDLGVDNSVEAFLHADDPKLIHYNEFRDDFGRDDVTLIAIRPREVFDLAFLEMLRDMHEDLEDEVPYVDEVTSMVNARSTRGEGNELIVGDLLDEWPRNQLDLSALRERVFANPLYLDSLISRDGSLTTITIEPIVYSPRNADPEALEGFEDAGETEPEEATPPGYLTDLESAEMVQAVRRVMRRYESPDLEMLLAGVAVVEERLEVEMQSDLARFLTLSVVTIMVVLFVVFRRASGVVLPLLTVILSLVTTMGGMALFGISLVPHDRDPPAFPAYDRCLLLGTHTGDLLPATGPRLSPRGRHPLRPGPLGAGCLHDRADHGRRTGLLHVGGRAAGKRARHRGPVGRDRRHDLRTGAPAGPARGRPAARTGPGAADREWLSHPAGRGVRQLLGAGFMIFMLAYMQNIVEFGLLCAFATGMAFLADVTLAPALMVLVTRDARSSPPARCHRQAPR